jgi:alkyl hydroperoxide reductase subunit AhpC
VRALEALQTGELCPVNWQPGQPTLGRAERGRQSGEVAEQLGRLAQRK